MTANKKSWTEQAQADTVKKNDAQTTYRVTLSNNQDYSEVLDISGARTMMLDSLNNISSDTLKIYIASANTAAVRGFPGGDFATGSITYGAPAVGDTVVIDGTTCTCVAAAPGANEFSNITELEALVDAVSGVNSYADATAIHISASAGGTAGNSITLAVGVGNTGTMAVSGATLSGGAATDEWGEEYLNNTGVNPFAVANAQILGISAVGLCALIVVRDGEADGDINFAVSITNI